MFLLICSFATRASDTLRFRIQYGIIVIPGMLNGVPTEFVFDTGSPITITCGANNRSAGIIPKKRVMVAADANGKAKLLPVVTISAVQLGTQVFRNIRGITAEMPALACNQQVLLGQDIILQRNWLFDFENMKVIMSRDSIATEPASTFWTVQLKSKKPYVPLALTKDTTLDCLIDLGFSGVFDAGPLYPAARQIIWQKQANSLVYQRITRSMALHGYGPPVVENFFVADTVLIHGTPFHGLLVASDDRSSTKLGTAFFSGTCRQLVLHHNSSRYELRWKKQYALTKTALDVSIGYDNGQLFVDEKNIGTNAASIDLQMGEAIESVNGKRASDFADQCAFINWWYGNKFNKLEILKKNGKKQNIETVLIGTALKEAK
jgi:hypothetical protein